LKFGNKAYTTTFSNLSDMNMQNNVYDAFEHAQKQIRQACDLYGECRLDQNKYEVISHPRRIIEVNIPVKMDNGNIRMFT